MTKKNSTMTKKKSKMLLLSMLATANLADDAEARDWVGKMPYSVRGAFGIKREVMIHPNNVMKSLRKNSETSNNLPSLHRLQGRTLTQANLNRLKKNEQHTLTRTSQKKTKSQYKSKRKRK
jgi:hypothetical protein